MAKLNNAVGRPVASRWTEAQQSANPVLKLCPLDTALKTQPSRPSPLDTALKTQPLDTALLVTQTVGSRLYRNPEYENAARELAVPGMECTWGIFEGF